MGLTNGEVLANAREMNVKFVRLQFTDILGIVKNVAIPVALLEDALEGKVMFDGSSIEGFVRSEESDMYLQPDPDTWALFPWKPREGMTARLMCDIKNPDGSPFAGCPRTALKKVLDEAQSMGYRVQIGTEPEFFLFEQDDHGAPTTHTIDQAGYFDLSPVDKGEDLRREMVLTLQDMGIDVEATHHEVAPGQHEIDMTPTDALRAADNIATLRFVIRTIALQHHMHATFMPKPVQGLNGSGLHINQSLFTQNANAFMDLKHADGISRVALRYIGGLIHHARALTAVTNP
ncbi:MAG: glutamine synthetase family protein, partial [Firmicutes bacterium]|nr:glutamine synthetase family protein [Bacillota bacterium]